MQSEANSEIPSVTERGFLARGLVYQGLRDFAQLRLPGGLPSLLARLPIDEAARLGGTLLASEWYDALPVAVIAAEAAKLADQPLQDYMFANARWQGERDLGALQKIFLGLPSPEEVALRLPRAAGHYFNFGGGESQLIGARCIRLTKRHIPRSLVAWFHGVCLGFADVVLTRAGARNLIMDLVSSEAEAKEGLDSITLFFELSWK